MNENNKTNKYFQKWRQVKLSESSRNRIEENLKEYASFNPVRNEGSGRYMKQVPQGTPSFISIFNFNKTSMTAAILTLALVVGGGTSFAAEGAVPGDFLYPVKTEVNENVKSALAISNEAEAELQANLAKERLEEAETLANRGELTSEIATSIGADLKKHYEEARTRSGNAEASGNIEASAAVRSSLEGTMRTYAGILADLNSRVEGNQGASLVAEIRNFADVAANDQATATAKISADVKADVGATVERAESVVADIEAELEDAKADLSSETYSRIETRLGQAVEASVEARNKLEAEMYNQAYAASQKAMGIAKAAQAMLESSLRVELEVGVESLLNNNEIESDNNSNTNAGAETETNGEEVDDEETQNNDENQNSDNVEAGVEVDAETDASVETPVIDGNAETNTSVQSNTVVE